MVCSLICKQMSKRDDGYGSVRSRAAKAVDHCAEASDRVWRLGPALSRLLDDMMFTAIWSRFGDGRRAQASSLAGLSRCSGTMTKSVLQQSPLRQTDNR